MNIYLGKHFEAMIRKQIDSGRYANASEVVREALRRYEHEEEKLASLRAKIAVADAELERGEGIEVEDLDAYFESIWQRAAHRIQQQRKTA
jgi:antitoxin ParD1/3/4